MFDPLPCFHPAARSARSAANVSASSHRPFRPGLVVAAACAVGLACVSYASAQYGPTGLPGDGRSYVEPFPLNGGREHRHDHGRGHDCGHDHGDGPMHGHGHVPSDGGSRWQGLRPSRDLPGAWPAPAGQFDRPALSPHDSFGGRTTPSSPDDLGPRPGVAAPRWPAPTGAGPGLRFPTDDLDRREFPGLDPRWSEPRLPGPSSPPQFPTRPASWSVPRPERLPTLPTAPASDAADELRRRVASRHRDAKVLRLVQTLAPQTARSAYLEAARIVDSRHLAPQPYALRTRRALGNLVAVLDDDRILQTYRVAADRGTVRRFQEWLAGLAAQNASNSAEDALRTMFAVSDSARQIGLPPGVVLVEFLYGAIEAQDRFSGISLPENNGTASSGLDEQMVGIGVSLERDPAGARVVRAHADGPAARAGLRAEDVIVAVDGRPLAGFELDEVVGLITGQAGTPVRLEVRRATQSAALTLVRQQFHLAPVSGTRMLDPQSRVGYVHLERFSDSSARDLEQAMWTLHRQGMQSLVLDLRGNPGGLLTAAVEISNLFLPQGTIVSTRGRTAQDSMQETATPAHTWKVPLVVLVDGDSASASEIVAAALQENGRAVIVGRRTYGKGTVQTHFPFESLQGTLRITTAKFYSPRGREMAEHGVEPDVPVPLAASRSNDEVDLAAALHVARSRTTPDLAGPTRPSFPGGSYSPAGPSFPSGPSFPGGSSYPSLRPQRPLMPGFPG